MEYYKAIVAVKNTDGTPSVPEVCVFFHEKLMRGNRTTKINSESFGAFGSNNYPLLAMAGTDIQFYTRNIRKYIPWQVFLIYTAGAILEFILNATHIIPKDEGIVLGGFGQSLWCAYIVIQVIVLFLFTLIPYIVYNHKNTVAKAKTE